MVKGSYDTFIIGHISLDEIIYKGETSKMFGGAVVHSSYAAVAGGHEVGVFTKTAEKNEDNIYHVFNIDKEHIYHGLSFQTTSIRNEYLTEDRERRTCTALSVADPFRGEEVPVIQSKIYHLAGLIAGDFENEMIKLLSQRGMVAVDVQGFLRRNINGEMTFMDWEEKMTYLPYIDFLKTDAAEAEIMTGKNNRKEAAQMLYGWGAKEVMITHNSEVLIYDGKDFYSKPLKPRNLSGRTGRGDSCFSAYITERLTKSPEEALLYAAALVSLKMETEGPFRGSRADVVSYMEKYY